MGQINLKEIKAMSYKKTEIKKGYTDQSLRINLDANNIIINPIEEKIKDKFIGGKGYDLWLMWNAVSGDTKWERNRCGADYVDRDRSGFCVV